MPKKILQTVHDERPIAGGRRLRLEFGEERGERVPAVLLLPAPRARAGAAAPAASPRWPAAVLLHGYSSRKETMSDSVGAALLREGVASLAVDLPMHGEREGDVDFQSVRNPLELMRRWRLALEESRLALRYLGARRDIDGARLAIVGYSLGAFLGITVAAGEPAARAVVLAAGGDLPDGSPFTALARKVVNPLKSARQLAGRPLLLVHGRWDRTVRPPQAERLFAAAGEPKEIRWWDAGHILPAAAIADAARWLRDRLSESAERARNG